MFVGCIRDGIHFLIMGCTTSKSDIQLGSIKAWDYKVDGKAKSVSEEELQTLRKVCCICLSLWYRSFGKVAREEKQRFGMCCTSAAILC